METRLNFFRIGRNMEGNIHAALLICTLLFTIFLLWRYGKLKVKLYKIIIAPLLGILVFFSSNFFFMCHCGAGNNPSIQAWLPAACCFVLVLFLRPLKLTLVVLLLMAMIGFGLCRHFHKLVLPEDDQLCLYTGDTVVIHCSKKVEPVKLWHTFFTGLYGLKELKIN